MEVFIMSASELFCQQINANTYLLEWKNKINQKLNNGGYKVGEPTEDTIVNYAMDFIYEYHNSVNNGRLYANNRLPNEEDVEAFDKFVSALLFEWQSVSSFEHPSKVQERISKKLSEALKNNNDSE